MTGLSSHAQLLAMRHGLRLLPHGMAVRGSAIHGCVSCADSWASACWRCCRWGGVEVIVEPAPWWPRRDNKRRSRIVTEHRHRQGDPTICGSTLQPIMTAYRQQALACAAALSRTPARPCDPKGAAPDAAKILRRNVYGWFVRVERGVYDPADSGREALIRWPM